MKLKIQHLKLLFFATPVAYFLSSTDSEVLLVLLSSLTGVIVRTYALYKKTGLCITWAFVTEALSVSADQLHCGGKMFQLSTIHVPSD
jgi:hypothetical protein